MQEQRCTLAYKNERIAHENAIYCLSPTVGVSLSLYQCVSLCFLFVLCVCVWFSLAHSRSLSLCVCVCVAFSLTRSLSLSVFVGVSQPLSAPGSAPANRLSPRRALPPTLSVSRAT
jgi:hypothetical protein